MGHLPPVSPPKGKRETRDTFTGGGGTLPGNYQVSHTGTYTGDPPSGLTTRGAFLGWKSNQEVRCGVESGVRVFGRS